MGFLHECPSCHKMCEQNICTRTDAKGYETELLECSGCKHTWFATHVITEVNLDIVTCPKCGSYETTIDEGPAIFDDCMHFRQTCYDCGHQWTGIYSLPERIGVEDESNFLEDDDKQSKRIPKMDRPQFLPCPVCSSLVIDYTRVEPITEQQVVITQKCENCGHQWEDTFWVERSTNLEE